MTTRNVPVDLGDGEEVVSVTIKGCPCAVEDLQMAIVAFARQWKRERKAHTAPPAAKAPCGCQDK